MYLKHMLEKLKSVWNFVRQLNEKFKKCFDWDARAHAKLQDRWIMSWTRIEDNALHHRNLVHTCSRSTVYNIFYKNVYKFRTEKQAQCAFSSCHALLGAHTHMKNETYIGVVCRNKKFIWSICPFCCTRLLLLFEQMCGTNIPVFSIIPCFFLQSSTAIRKIWNNKSFYTHILLQTYIREIHFATNIHRDFCIFFYYQK